MADNLSLAGKTALITGSGRENGIGAAIARIFARNGAAVAIHYVSESSKIRAEKVAAGIARDFGAKVTIVHGAATSQERAKDLVEQTLKGLGAAHIDILVNNGAVMGAQQLLLTATREDLLREFDVNVFGTTLMTQAAVIHGKMPSGGRIINVGSIASKLLPTPQGIYNASKCAQDATTTQWAAELGSTHGITVNTIAPGPVFTDAASIVLNKPDGSVNDEFVTPLVAMTRAADRVGTADDVADMALLLVSEKSRWVTAQYISASGGITGTM